MASPVCAKNEPGTYRENIMGSDDATRNQSDGSTNRIIRNHLKHASNAQCLRSMPPLTPQSTLFV
jgi:hypothetical protein